MPQPTCRHVHANGALCKSPPLRNRDYCHFHLDQIGRQLRAARARARHQPAGLRLPLLEDPFAVQVALMQVADAIIHDEIDAQRGRLLMSVLRLASRNLTTARQWEPEPLFVADTNAGANAAEWRSFEQENELPPDFDLTVDPERAFPEEESSGINRLQPNATEGANAVSADQVLRACIRQALDDANQPVPQVSADQLQLMDIYDREGQQAAKKFSDQMARNERRRQRRQQRAYYEEQARRHNITIAARRLVEEQQRKSGLAAGETAQLAAEDAGALEHESRRKKPVSSAAAKVKRDTA